MSLFNKDHILLIKNKEYSNPSRSSSLKKKYQNHTSRFVFKYISSSTTVCSHCFLQNKYQTEPLRLILKFQNSKKEKRTKSLCNTIFLLRSSRHKKIMLVIYHLQDAYILWIKYKGASVEN